MRPHPKFQSHNIPNVHSLGGYRLTSLSVDDLVRDFAAVKESAADIKAANPGMHWPEGLTLEENLIDLAWHQKEFAKKRSFAWVIEDEQGNHQGCLYVYPSIAGENKADVHWWWRSGFAPDGIGFRATLTAWLASDAWPDLTYQLHD